MCTQMDPLQMLLETVLTIFLMDRIEGRTLPTSSANPTPRHPHKPVIYILKKTEWSRILRDLKSWQEIINMINFKNEFWKLENIWEQKYD